MTLLAFLGIDYIPEETSKMRDPAAAPAGY